MHSWRKKWRENIFLTLKEFSRIIIGSRSSGLQKSVADQNFLLSSSAMPPVHNVKYTMQLFVCSNVKVLCESPTCIVASTILYLIDCDLLLSLFFHCINHLLFIFPTYSSDLIFPMLFPKEIWSCFTSGVLLRVIDVFEAIISKYI